MRKVHTMRSGSCYELVETDADACMSDDDSASYFLPENIVATQLWWMIPLNEGRLSCKYKIINGTSRNAFWFGNKGNWREKPPTDRPTNWMNAKQACWVSVFLGNPYAHRDVSNCLAVLRTDDVGGRIIFPPPLATKYPSMVQRISCWQSCSCRCWWILCFSSHRCSSICTLGL